MANSPHQRQGSVPSGLSPASQENSPPIPAKSPAPAWREPEVRRWSRPARPECCRQEDPFLHYVRCALSYQNQMLADIKALLEQIQLNTDRDGSDPGKE